MRRQYGKCKHCGKQRQIRGRGLCHACRKSVGHLYQTTSKYAARGHYVWSGQPIPPTEVPPGTREKLDVLAERAKAGMALHAKGDATFAGMDATRLLHHGDGAAHRGHRR